ncbi:hypothetical protein [Candidatus Palauibacter sp.]|uniref:hypothetical protein n=1 Tax=Candidatus Palauibacter sp. TaxID=3101350 RepID=UPI003B525249
MAEDPLFGQIAQKVVRIYKKWHHLRGTQIVFLDGGVTAGYGALKDLLVRRRIPERQVMFARKNDSASHFQLLFRLVNAGKVRVVIAQTQALLGANIQQRLVALHHGDVPRSGSHLQRRTGCILRPGNMLWEKGLIPGVGILRYTQGRPAEERAWRKVQEEAEFMDRLLSGEEGSIRIP